MLAHEAQHVLGEEEVLASARQPVRGQSPVLGHLLHGLGCEVEELRHLDRGEHGRVPLGAACFGHQTTVAAS